MQRLDQRMDHCKALTTRTNFDIIRSIYSRGVTCKLCRPDPNSLLQPWQHLQTYHSLCEPNVRLLSPRLLPHTSSRRLSNGLRLRLDRFPSRHTCSRRLMPCRHARVLRKRGEHERADVHHAVDVIIREAVFCARDVISLQFGCLEIVTSLCESLPAIV